MGRISPSQFFIHFAQVASRSAVKHPTHHPSFPHLVGILHMPRYTPLQFPLFTHPGCRSWLSSHIFWKYWVVRHFSQSPIWNDPRLVLSLEPPHWTLLDSLSAAGGSPTSHKGCSAIEPDQVCKGSSTGYKGFDDILHWSGLKIKINSTPTGHKGCSIAPHHLIHCS